MRVAYLTVAQQELADAVAFYDAERVELGNDFIREVVRAMGRIRAFPQAWPKASKRSRKCRLSRFPYSLIYQSRDDGILILAVAHASRRPGYWRDRE